MAKNIPAWWLADNQKFLLPQRTLVFSGRLTRKAEFQHLDQQPEVLCRRETGGSFLVNGVACIPFVHEGRSIHYYLPIGTEVRMSP